MAIFNFLTIRRGLIFVSLLVCFNVQAGTSWEKLNGEKSIMLTNTLGEKIQIGTVDFQAVGADSKTFKITLKEDTMNEYFLAMRPFKCVAGTTQQYCLFPVSNEPPIVTEGDFTTLEYQLMFMKTKPNALHINPFNGIYYRFSLDDKGGLVGVQHELDMDPFITPDSVPADRRLRPIRAVDLQDVQPQSAWMPMLIIR